MGIAGDTPFLTTEDLINLLAIKHPEAWGDRSPYGKKLTPQRLGKMLSEGYKIHSGREDRLGHRGYYRSAFTQVWRQMRVTPLSNRRIRRRWRIWRFRAG